MMVGGVCVQGGGGVEVVSFEGDSANLKWYQSVTLGVQTLLYNMYNYMWWFDMLR